MRTTSRHFESVLVDCTSPDRLQLGLVYQPLKGLVILNKATESFPTGFFQQIVILRILRAGHRVIFTENVEWLTRY